MAPNLTQMADSFHMTTDAERDLYLGSYCALAVGVFSFPLAAGIGFAADIHTTNRQALFVATIAGGAVAAALTAVSQSYWQLFLCRWASGAFMAGSVPVAFSFLGDLFAAEERNAASSGLYVCCAVFCLFCFVLFYSVVCFTRLAQNLTLSSFFFLFPHSFPSCIERHSWDWALLPVKYTPGQCRRIGAGRLAHRPSFPESPHCCVPSLCKNPCEVDEKKCCKNCCSRENTTIAP